MTSPITKPTEALSACAQAEELKLLMDDYASDLVGQVMALQAGKSKGGLPAAYFEKEKRMGIKAKVITEKIQFLSACVDAIKQSKAQHSALSENANNPSIKMFGNRLQDIDLLYC